MIIIVYKIKPQTKMFRVLLISANRQRTENPLALLFVEGTPFVHTSLDTFNSI